MFGIIPNGPSGSQPTTLQLPFGTRGAYEFQAYQSSLASFGACGADHSVIGRLRYGSGAHH